jgi:hypothetical protein
MAPVLDIRQKNNYFISVSCAGFIGGVFCTSFVRASVIFIPIY